MSLSNITITVEVDGTTNDGQIVDWQAGGTVPCRSVTENRRTITDTATKIWSVSGGDDTFALIVVINEGTTDGEVRVQSVLGETYALAVPAGAVVQVPYQWTNGTTQAYEVWLRAFTGGSTDFKYFVLA